MAARAILRSNIDFRSAPAPGQLSHAKTFYRPPLRAARSAPIGALPLTRIEAMVFWSDLLRRHCGSAERAAAQFDVTFQTACNWLACRACPSGDKMLEAVRLWPNDFKLWAPK